MENLSKQDQDFVNEVAITGNATQAVKKAYKGNGYSEGYTREKGRDLLTKPDINTAIAEVKSKLADHFKTEDIAQRIQEGLLAGKMVGEVLEPDYAVRHKYVQTVVDIRGDRAPEKNINLNIQTDITNPKARELAEEYEEKLKKGL